MNVCDVKYDNAPWYGIYIAFMVVVGSCCAFSDICACVSLKPRLQPPLPEQLDNTGYALLCTSNKSAFSTYHRNPLNKEYAKKYQISL